MDGFEAWREKAENRRETKMNILLAATLTAVFALLVDVIRHFSH